MIIPTLTSAQENFTPEHGDDLIGITPIDRTGVNDFDIDLQSVWVEVKESCIEFSTRKFNISFEEKLEEAKLRKTIHAIVSVTGDDEIIATDAVVLAILHFMCAKYISGIALSEKDTNISNRKGNYAEGWIIMPPNKEASIDAITRRHMSTGVALLMDLIKLKQISAVRKQSQLETDFESKYKDLYKSVEWIDKDWITYDYGQMSLIFATCIFDFRESSTTPYLYKTEGGCGGLPPWNNVDTALAGIEHMSRGTSTQAILWIMTEAVLIQKNKLKPSDAQFIGASHFAQQGSQKLGELKGLAKTLTQLNKEEKLALLESVRDENPVPPTLKEKSVVVQPRDKLLGCAISELRKNGLVMTELDLQMQIAKQNKYMALLGNVNMGMVIKEQDENLRKAKRNGYRILASIGTSENVQPVNNPYITMKDYYEMRQDYSDITAFSYAGEIRIFKSKDVLEYYESQAGSLQDEITASMPAARNYRVSQKVGTDKQKVEYQIAWMETGEVNQLFEGELPPGIGSDDARIMRKLSIQIPKLDKVTVFVILSDDNGMITKLEAFVKNYPLAYILQIRKSDYIPICLRNEQNRRGEVLIYNFITGKECAFTGLSSRIARHSLSWRNKPQYQIIWDFPNIIRGIEYIKYDRKQGTYIVPSGGFLKRETIRKTKWSHIEWDQFKKFKDFKVKRRHYSVFQARAQRAWY